MISSPKKVPTSGNTTRRDKREHKQAIIRAYRALEKKYHRPPTQAEVAELVGLSRKTVGRHLRALKEEDD